MLKKIYVMFAFMILISVSTALALNIDVGCPTNVAFQAGANIECLVKNPDTNLGVNLMSLTVDSVSGGASFVKVETLTGTLKLFETDTYKKGFIGTADKAVNVFKITLKTNTAIEAVVNLKDVVVKTGDAKEYKGSDISIFNNKVTFASGPVPCTASDWTVSWGPCSATCGGGTQLSTVTKKGTCTGEVGKPAASQSCNTQDCALFTCTGSVPANAVLCSGDNQGLIINTPITLVAACGVNKCEYSCNSGNELKGGACVPICTPSCTGKTCGADGCGGSCGSCAADKPLCVNFQCSASAQTCTDKIKNQAETGVDCGGPCPACGSETLKVETTDQDTYNLLTAIRNNLDALPDKANTLQKISAIASALKGYFK